MPQGTGPFGVLNKGYSDAEIVSFDQEIICVHLKQNNYENKVGLCKICCCLS